MKNQAFDFSVNALQALLWQHDNAPKLTGLIEAKQAWYDTNQTEFWNDWIADVFDLRTANAFGMTVWAVILGFPLTVILDPDFATKPVFGFGPFGKGFDRSNFGRISEVVQPLTLAQQRLVLQLRYFQLISRGCVTQTNRFLARLFSSFGPAYMIDNLNMTITYRFVFDLPSSLQFVFQNFDLLPRPAAVAVNIVSGP